MTRRLDVELSDGSEFMLRYFDPRVLSELDEALVEKERDVFFAFSEKWLYLNRDAKLREISPHKIAPIDQFVSPLRIDKGTEAALILATERKLSSQLSHEGIESSGLFGSFGLLGLRRVWVEVNGVDEAPIACLA
jgi:hypothetical protein